MGKIILGVSGMARCRLRSIGLLVVLAALLSGCSAHGLAFREDKRLVITAPEDEAVVTESATITWTMDDFEVTGETGETSPDEGYFGVFLNRFPPPPGVTLDWFLRDDLPCQKSPVCPNKKYYAARGIFTTTDTSFTLPILPRPTDSERAEIHHITIVLLDGSGRRIGESAWSVDFELDREDD